VLHARRPAIALFVLFLGACGGGDSIGTLPGDQGAATGLGRRAACARYDRIVGDPALGTAETTERLQELADETATDGLAEQIRAAAGSDRRPTGSADRPARCRGA
jgi:hypothetical protein